MPERNVSSNSRISEQIDGVIRSQISYSSVLIQQRSWKKLEEFLNTTDPHEVASIIAGLAATDKILAYRMLSEDHATQVFMCLEWDEQEKLLYAFTDNEAAAVLVAIAPDDRTRFLGDLPPTVVLKLLKLLPLEERKIANTLLNYPEDSAGRIMTPEYCSFPPDLSAQEALDLIKSEYSQKETIYSIFILDLGGRLIGLTTLAELLFAPEKKKLKDFMKDDPVCVNTSTDQEEVARIMKYYDITVLPITDRHSRMVGIVTQDDILDIIQEEATEDFQRFTGISPSEISYLSTPIWSLVLSRSGWVMVLLVISGFSQDVLLRYGELLRKYWIDLSLFFTVLVGVGGNIGSQSSILVIRGISVGEITQNSMLQLIWRALFTGFFMGLLLATVLYLRIIVFGTGQSVKWVATASMILIVMASNSLGAVLPLLLKRLSIDPAIVSAPLISTLMDLGGLILYLEIAQRLLL